MSNTIPCCTSVSYFSYNLSCEQRLYSWSASYLSIWNHKKVEIFGVSSDSNKPKIEHGILVDSTPSLLWTCLKIISYCLVIFVLIAAIVQCIHRSSHQFQLLSEELAKQFAEVKGQHLRTPQKVPITSVPVISSVVLSTPLLAPSQTVVAPIIAAPAPIITVDTEPVPSLFPCKIDLYLASMQAESMTTASEEDLDSLLKRITETVKTHHGKIQIKCADSSKKELLIQRLQAAASSSDPCMIEVRQNPANALDILIEPKILALDKTTKSCKCTNGVTETALGGEQYKRVYPNGEIEIGDFSPETNLLRSGYRKWEDGTEELVYPLLVLKCIKLKMGLVEAGQNPDGTRELVTWHQSRCFKDIKNFRKFVEPLSVTDLLVANCTQPYQSGECRGHYQGLFFRKPACSDAVLLNLIKALIKNPEDPKQLPPLFACPLDIQEVIFEKIIQLKNDPSSSKQTIVKEFFSFDPLKRGNLFKNIIENGIDSACDESCLKALASFFPEKFLQVGDELAKYCLLQDRNGILEEIALCYRRHKRSSHKSQLLDILSTIVLKESFDTIQEMWKAQDGEMQKRISDFAASKGYTQLPSSGSLLGALFSFVTGKKS